MNSKIFFAELRRRNVYKVAVAYAVVGWLLVQITTQVFPIFEIPNWALRLIVLAIIIGFPIALVIAWAFELTPEGLKRTEDVDLAAQARRKSHAWIYIVIFGVLLSLSLFFLGRFTASTRQNGATEVPEKSIAVLPFENLSDEKANAYFAEGMQDEIITRLSKLGALKVISRTSTAHYGNKPGNLPVIAQELGVAHILEGSVQKAGETVHINVQLIRAVTDEHLWAESYDRDFKNVFAIERDIAETVASQLKTKLLPQEATDLARLPTTNAKAYDLYLRAKFIDHQYWNAQLDSNQPAIDLFQQALDLDPNFVDAYAGLGFAQLRLYWGGESHDSSLLEKIQATAEKALAIQPDSISAHLLLAGVLEDRQDDRATAEIDYLEKRASHDPAVILRIATFKGDKGDMIARMKALQKLTELDPRNDRYFRMLGDTYAFLTRYAEADIAYRKAITIAPEDWALRANTAGNLINLNKLTEARNEVVSWPEDKLTATALTFKYLILEEIELLFRNYDAALAAARKMPVMGDRIPTVNMPVGDIKRNTDIGFCLLYKGDERGAREAFEAAQKALDAQSASRSSDPGFLSAAADIAAGLGQREKAIDYAQKGAAAAPKQRSLLIWAEAQLELASIYARFGDAPEALPILKELMETPGAAAVSVTELRLHPQWDPIRNDAGFQQLLAGKEQIRPNK